MPEVGLPEGTEVKIPASDEVYKVFGETMEAADRFAWGKRVEDCALKMWTEYIGDTVHRVETFARVDGIAIPGDGSDRPYPYLVEVKGHRKPLLNIGVPMVGLKMRIYNDLTRMASHLRTHVVWIVVYPDCAKWLQLPAPPDKIDSGRAFFRVGRFVRVPQDTFKKHFDWLRAEA